jgi:ubiquinone/menaquinone biosynthesis C-methylase UbiE
MREDSVALEDGRLEGYDLENYPWVYERHRAFPEIFGQEKYGRILDIAAGIGLVAKRIHDNYPGKMICNDVAVQSLKSLRANGLTSVSFDLDDPVEFFPFQDASFDAIVSLATVEHIINIEHHLQEIRRILKPGGHLYISAPNYSNLYFLPRFVWDGKTFHDPMKGGMTRYEFLAHVRYFTYKTLLEFISSFGFQPDFTYLPIPKGSTFFQNLSKRSPFKARVFQLGMRLLYTVLPPRWALHPILRFTNLPGSENPPEHLCPRKVIV